MAAQLRGEAKAAGQGPEAVVAAVAEELEGIGLEPDPAELHRRYEEIDPDLPELTDVDDGRPEARHPADADPDGAPVARWRRPGPADGAVSAGVDAGR